MQSENSIAAVQFEPAVGDPEVNYGRIEALVAALEDAASIAVFPELCVTGYDVEAASTHASSVPGRLTDPLVDLASEYDIDIVAGVPERRGESLYNGLVFATAEGVQSVYRKQYLWGEEREWFSAGTSAVTVDTAVGRIGFLVCYDLNFPEAAVEYARTECDVLVVSAAWRDSYRQDWTLLLRSRALDGTCYVVGANHTGAQSGRKHAGSSTIAGPVGDVVAQLDDREGFLTCEISREALHEARERNPVFASRESK